MKKTVVLIRCTEATPRVGEVAMQILDQGLDVIAVPDLMSVPEAQHAHVLAAFPIPTEPLTEEFIAESGLTFWNDRARTGWACGDYVFYRALNQEWDFAWIIEPDVYFLNGAPSILSEMEGLDTDLITTNYWRASKDWYWRKPLVEALPALDVHAMAFPLARVSRKLAISSFELRKRVASDSNPGSRVPNDESVLATAAGMNDYTTLDLKKKFPSEFRYWSTVLKYPINDLRNRESQPLVVHSGLEDEDFMIYVMSLWSALERGSKRDQERLSRVLNVASAETLRNIIAELGFRFVDAGSAAKTS